VVALEEATEEQEDCLEALEMEMVRRTKVVLRMEMRTAADFLYLLTGELGIKAQFEKISAIKEVL
jgi:hypothetical protein